MPCDRRADLKGVQGIAEQLKHEVEKMVDAAGSDWDHDPLRPLYFVLEALFQLPASL